MIHFGLRDYNPTLEKWDERDPTGSQYINGLDLYQSVIDNPLRNVDPSGLCKLDLHFTRLGPGYYHSYIVVTDTNGTQTYYRAGPSNGGPGNGSVRGTAGAVGSASGTTGMVVGGSTPSPGGAVAGGISSGATGVVAGGASAKTSSGGNWGPISAQSGPYNNTSIDWDPKSIVITVVNDGKKCDCDKMLQNYINAVNAAAVHYDPLGPNSNSFAFEALKYIGLNAPQNGPMAPGSDNWVIIQPPPEDMTKYGWANVIE